MSEEKPDPARYEAGHLLARAAGGHMIHALPPGTRVALCGHEPRSGARQMTKRAKWYHAGPHAKGVTCEKCRAKLPEAA